MAAELIRYEALCREMSEYKTVDEVKDILDVAVGMEVYARKAKNRSLEADAAETRLRATRRLDELRKAQFETVGPATGAQGIGTSAGFSETRTQQPPTLAQAGIDKNLAHRMRTLGKLSEVQFEAVVTDTRDRIVAEVDRINKRTINVATRSGTKASPIEVIDGTYHCIVIDPPWDMEKIERDVRPNQVGFEYPTMTEDELADFDVGSMAADDCHLFCWTTQKYLPVAIRLIDTWGFKYLCTFVWHKPGGFQPIGLPQYNSEFIVYARLGSPKFQTTKNFFTCFNAPRREHSRKPDEFYNTVIRVCSGPRIDVFSREERPGFDQYGNETDKFSGAA